MNVENAPIMTILRRSWRFALMLIGILAFFVFAFFLSWRSVSADYTTATGCLESAGNLGTELSDISVAGGQFSTQYTGSSATITVGLYAVDNSCGLSGAVYDDYAGISTNDQLAVVLISPTVFEVQNLTTNTVLDSFTYTAGAKGVVAFAYKTSAPSSHNVKSDSYSFTVGAEPIMFLSPTDDRKGTDFLNFSFISDSQNLDTGTHRIRVDYGLGNTTDYTDYGEYFYIYAGLTYQNLPVTKTNDLGVDTGYQAQGCLLDDTDTEVYCTPVIDFEILAGSQTSYFTGLGTITQAVDPTLSCGQTAFAIPEFDLALGYTFPRVDFGQGLCKTVAFLFVPSEDSMANLATIRTTSETVAPFSYFLQIQTALSDYSGTTGTIPTLTITTDIGGNAVSSEIFSPDTLEEYVSPTTLGIFRTLMAVVLYLAFITLVWTQSSRLFNKNQ